MRALAIIAQATLKLTPLLDSQSHLPHRFRYRQSGFHYHVASRCYLCWNLLMATLSTRSGDIHFNLLLDPDEPEQGKKTPQCLDEIIFCINIQRHPLWRTGCWVGKKEFVDRELDLNSLDLIHNIKPQFEPNGILNPN